MASQSEWSYPVMPLVACIRREKCETHPRTAHARGNACLKEQEFYDQNGGFVQRILYRVISALS